MSMQSVPKSGNITAAQASANASVSIETIQAGTVGIKITGTFSATLTFEATMDGTNWDLVPAYTIGTSPALATGTTNTAGFWRASVAGYAQFRVNCPVTYSSGTAVVTLVPCLATFVN